MKLTQTDITSLAAIVVGGIVGIAAFGPQHFVGSGTMVSIDRESVHVIVEIDDVDGQISHADEQSVDPVGESIVIAGRGADSGEPLVYIDGVLVEEMPDLDPDQIERIEVLKGAAALGLYGEDASNGVIQIFLKEDPVPNPGG